jgi:2-hydroxy-3-oxopropionate reductase
MSGENTIGFIGLGIMGKPMAANLCNAGYQLVVHDIDRKPVKELGSLGAEAASSPKEVAERSDYIITMLPDSPDVERVALDRNGLIAGVKPGMLYTDMSTIAPTVAVEIARKLGKKGVRCLDAPVSGGEVGAQKAILSIKARTGKTR